MLWISLNHAPLFAPLLLLITLYPTQLHTQAASTIQPCNHNADLCFNMKFCTWFPLSLSIPFHHNLIPLSGIGHKRHAHTTTAGNSKQRTWIILDTQRSLSMWSWVAWNEWAIRRKLFQKKFYYCMELLLATLALLMSRIIGLTVTRDVPWGHRDSHVRHAPGEAWYSALRIWALAARHLAQQSDKDSVNTGNRGFHGIPFFNQNE